MPQSLKVYKIFVASPNDVAEERRIIFKVIEEINHIYERENRDCRLEIWAWEKSHPDWGNPQEVIRQQIPIESCDIFIGIFWRHFGKPTGNIRPDDGKPYLSGTEEEIEIAAAARKKSVNNRPVIMLYRKIDPIPVEMTAEDLDQLKKVNDFFNKIESGIGDTALVRKTKRSKLRNLLKEDLLHAVAQIEPSSTSKDDSSTHNASAESNVFNQSHQQVTSQENIAGNVYYNIFTGGQRPISPGSGFRSWYDRVELLGNPFQHLTAEDDTQLLNYLIQPQALRHLGTQICGESDLVHWIIYADRGHGKTALRKMIAAKRYPLKPNDDLLCIVIDLYALETVVEYAHNTLESISSIHYMQVIQELVLRNVRDKRSKAISECISQVQDSTPARRRLWSLTEILRQQGFKGLLCLIDQVDEVKVTEARPEKMVQLLYPLMDLSLQTSPDVAFRYFLPASLKQSLEQQANKLRLVRYKHTDLVWENDDLKHLIAQRLIAFSKSPIHGYISLGQLCEPAGNFSAVIDQMLVEMARQNPRATVWLANSMFELHCQRENPPHFIQPATWEQVKEDWERWGRSQIFGPLKGFGIIEERIYFEGQEVRLSEKSNALLRCLIRANGGICSKSELIGAGWPSDNAEGVSAGALMEAIRRMKNELKSQGIDPEWICNAKRQGYYLRSPHDIRESAAGHDPEGDWL